MTHHQAVRAAHRRPAQGRQLHARRVAAQGRRRRQEGRSTPIARPAVACACAARSTASTTPPACWRRCSWWARSRWCCSASPGASLDFHVPGTDAYAGYCMAAAGFLALAHTLKRGEHIRVTLILEHVAGRARRALELWALAVGDAARRAVRVLQRPARVPVVGLQRHLDRQRRHAAVDPAARRWRSARSILAIALVDELVLEWRGRRARKAHADRGAAQ